MQARQPRRPEHTPAQMPCRPFTWAPWARPGRPLSLELLASMGEVVDALGEAAERIQAMAPLTGRYAWEWHALALELIGQAETVQLISEEWAA